MGTRIGEYAVLLGILGRWPGAGSEKDSPTGGRTALLQMPAAVLLGNASG